MPTGIPRAATPQEIARYGHIAAAIRSYMKAHGIEGLAGLNRVLGLDSTHTSVHKWMHAKGAPGPEYRKKLGKVLGVDPDSLRARKPGAPGQAVVVARVAPGAVSERPRPAAEVLSFSVNAEGQARIKLDVVLPITPASAVLRMLLDAGVVMGDTAP